VERGRSNAHGVCRLGPRPQFQFLVKALSRAWPTACICACALGLPRCSAGTLVPRLSPFPAPQPRVRQGRDASTPGAAAAARRRRRQNLKSKWHHRGCGAACARARPVHDGGHRRNKLRRVPGWACRAALLVPARTAAGRLRALGLTAPARTDDAERQVAPCRLCRIEQARHGSGQCAMAPQPLWCHLLFCGSRMSGA